MWKAAAATALLLLSTRFPGNVAQQEACLPHAAMDLVFLVEGSGNITPREFREVKSLLCYFVDVFHVGRDQLRIGLVQFGSDLHTEFHLGSFYNKAEIKKRIQKMKQLGGVVQTGRVLDFLQNHRITEAQGSRVREGVPQVRMLVHKVAEPIPPAVRRMLWNCGILIVTVPLWMISTDRMNNSLDASEISQILCRSAKKPTLQVYPVCPQGVALDVIFLLDGSYTTDPQEFTRIKEFLYVLVDRFYVHPDQVQFGLLQGSERAAKSFQFYKNKEQLQRLIWNLKQIDGTKTMTGLGLDFLLNHQFDETAGSRMRQGVPQIAVLITGQRSSDAAQEKAEELKKRGIVLFAIGARDAALEELKEIASKPENAYFVSNFLNLRDITENIVRSLCDTAEDGGKLTVRLPPGVNNAENQIILQRLWTLTIQCHYDEQYRDHVKYWCRTRARSSCATIVRSDTPETRGQVSISDDAARNVFHVTMRLLQTMDSDVYWCGVETNDTEIYVASLNLTVTAGAVGLSVFNNKLTGKKGDSVSVQCFYSEANRDKEKKWCRTGDWSSCLTAVGNRTSWGRVQLDIDDRRLIFTVTVRGLKHDATGWYWITAGDQYLPVHISVGTRNAAEGHSAIPEVTIPMSLTVQQSVSQRIQILHVLLHIPTILLYTICTVVAATMLWPNNAETEISSREEAE